MYWQSIKKSRDTHSSQIDALNELIYQLLARGSRRIMSNNVLAFLGKYKNKNLARNIGRDK